MILFLKDHLLCSPDRHLLPKAPYGSLIMGDMPGNGRSPRRGFPEIEGRIDYMGFATGVGGRRAHRMRIFPCHSSKISCIIVLMTSPGADTMLVMGLVSPVCHLWCSSMGRRGCSKGAALQLQSSTSPSCCCCLLCQPGPFPGHTDKASGGTTMCYPSPSFI